MKKTQTVKLIQVDQVPLVRIKHEKGHIFSFTSKMNPIMAMKLMRLKQQ